MASWKAPIAPSTALGERPSSRCRPSSSASKAALSFGMALDAIGRTPRMLVRSWPLTFRAISSCTRKLSARSPSKLPDQRWASLAASISSAVTRTRLPCRRTEPSTICRTPSVSAIWGSVRLLPLSATTDVREITFRLSTCASWLMISSVMPSLK